MKLNKRITAHRAQPLYTTSTHRDTLITPLVSSTESHCFFRVTYFLTNVRTVAFEPLKKKKKAFF